MNKNEFLQRLREDLSSLSDEERLNALKYYEEFFADAGEDKEDEVITEFVSPEDLANRIQDEIAELESKEYADKSDKAESGENIYNYNEKIPEKEEIPEEIIIQIKKENKNSGEKEKEQETKWQYQKNIYNSGNSKKNNNGALKIILLICTFPIWLPLLASVASVAFGLFMTLFGIAFAVASMALAGFIMIGAGFISVGYGITNVFIDISRALYPIGAGLVVSGVGIIMAYAFTKLSMVIFKSQFKFAGWAVNGIKNKFSRQGA